jgi:hypothetical protein
MVQDRKKSKLLLVASKGTTLVSSTPLSRSILPPNSEFISTIYLTSTLFRTLYCTLDRHFKTVFCDAAFIDPLCDGIEETFEQARTVVEEGVYVLGVGELRKRLRREEIGLGF